MRLTLALVLIAAAALLGGAHLGAAKSAPLGRTAPPAAERAPRANDKARAEAEQRDRAERAREERTERLTRSVCTGCGGPAVPFDPSGGVQAREAVGVGKRPDR